MLKHRDIILLSVQEIYWYYTMEPSVTTARSLLPDVKFIHGQPSIESLEDMDVKILKLVILDDMMDMTDKKTTFEDLKRLFTAVSHHGNMSVIFIVQDLYVNRHMTRLANQAENILAMVNGAAAYQIPKLCNKLFGPGHELFIRWAINDVHAHSNFGYLLLSTGATVPECQRVRTNIFPGEENTFYIKKGMLKTKEYQYLKEDVPEQALQN